MIRLSLLLLVALLGSCPLEPPHPRLATQQTSAEIPPIANRAAIPDFVSLVKREGGTVVNVSATRIMRGSELRSATGALVAVIEKASPAQDAGIMAGDVILRIDDKPVESPNDLSQIVTATPPGTTVRLHVWRRGAPGELAHTSRQPQAPA